MPCNDKLLFEFEEEEDSLVVAWMASIVSVRRGE